MIRDATLHRLCGKTAVLCRFFYCYSIQTYRPCWPCLLSIFSSANEILWSLSLHFALCRCPSLHSPRSTLCDRCVMTCDDWKWLQHSQHFNSMCIESARIQITRRTSNFLCDYFKVDQHFFVVGCIAFICRARMQRLFHALSTNWLFQLFGYWFIARCLNIKNHRNNKRFCSLFCVLEKLSKSHHSNSL